MLNLFSNSRKKDTFDFVVPMAYMAEKKEWDCRPHIERIRKYALLIGGGINIHRDDLELISIACQLHDIGKITIPDHLVNKDGKYDEPERAIIERHTSEGAKLLVRFNKSSITTGREYCPHSSRTMGRFRLPSAIKRGGNPIRWQNLCIG